MKSKNIISCLFLLPLSIFFHTTGYAQKQDEKTLLYNTVPVVAIVNDSAEVVKIVKSTPEYMQGYQLKVANYDKPADKGVQPVSSSSGYMVISSEYYDIPFKSGFAVLDDEAVALLDQIVAELKINPSKNLLISIYQNNMSSALYKNRINAIKSYVKIEGISLERIKINYLEGVSPVDELRINFIQ